MNTQPVAVALTPAGVLAVVISFLGAFNIWTPTTEQYNAILGLVALLVVIGAKVAHDRVTPTP